MVSDVSKLGVGLAETIRDRVRDPEPAGNPKAVAATEESMEARKFRAELRELRWADEILKAAAGVFRGRARPATTELVGLIAEHPDRVAVDGLRWGVEPIHRVLTEHGSRIALSTYDETNARTASRREVRNG